MEISQYWEGMTVIEAQESMVKLKIAEYPTLKREDKRKILNEFKKLAYPKGNEQKALSSKEFAQIMKRKGLLK